MVSVVGRLIGSHRGHGLVVTAALLLVAAGCGGDGDSPSDEENHTHTAAAIAEWEGPPPEVAVVIEGDAESGFRARAILRGFTLTSPEEIEHVAGQGHLHVIIDGKPMTMLYETEVALPDLEPGMHEIRMTLSRNDHLDYGIAGTVIGASASLEVPGTVVPVAVVVEVQYVDGDVVPDPQRVVVDGGSGVEIRVSSDVADTVHVHGYDLMVMLEPGKPGALRFTPEVRGIFEVELENAGELLAELVVE